MGVSKAMPRTWRGISSDGEVEPGAGDHLPCFLRLAAVEGPLEPSVGLEGGDLLWCVHEGIFSPADEGQEVFVAGEVVREPPEVGSLRWACDIDAQDHDA